MNKKRRLDQDPKEFDLFAKPMLEDIIRQDGELGKKVQDLATKNLSLHARYKEVQSDIANILSKAGELSHITSSSYSNKYDVAVEIAAKWSAFAGYAGSQVSLNHISQDERAGGLDEIRNAYKPKLRGTVVGVSSDKTAKVRVVSRKKEKRTGKYITSTKYYLIHDEYGKCRVGDKIIALESRPVNKRKHHILATIL